MRHCCFACLLEVELSSELGKRYLFQIRCDCLVGHTMFCSHLVCKHVLFESLTSELILYLKCSSQHHGWRYEVLYIYDGCNTLNGRVVNPHNAIDSIDSLTV